MSRPRPQPPRACLFAALVSGMLVAAIDTQFVFVSLPAHGCADDLGERGRATLAQPRWRRRAGRGRSWSGRRSPT